MWDRARATGLEPATSGVTGREATDGVPKAFRAAVDFDPASDLDSPCSTARRPWEGSFDASSHSGTAPLGGSRIPFGTCDVPLLAGTSVGRHKRRGHHRDGGLLVHEAGGEPPGLHVRERDDRLG